jgi:hypothetical protein
MIMRTSVMAEVEGVGADGGKEIQSTFKLSHFSSSKKQCEGTILLRRPVRRIHIMTWYCSLSTTLDKNTKYSMYCY